MENVIGNSQSSRLDNIDQYIIEAMRKDGREAFAQIAEKLNVSPGMVRQRYNRLVELGYLKVVAVTNPLMMGMRTMALIGIHTDGLKMLQASGVELAIISGRASRALERRARDLGIAQLFMGVENKLGKFESLLKSLSLSPAQCAGLGDDVIDLPFLSRCGFAAAVPAAPDYVKQHVQYVTVAEGGRGAVREFCDLIMQSQGTWHAAMKKYLG